MIMGAGGRDVDQVGGAVWMIFPVVMGSCRCP